MVKRGLSTEVQWPQHVQDQYLNAAAGASAGILASFVVCPLDVVKTRLQGQIHGKERVKYRGTVSALGKIFRQEGVKGLYRGLSPTLMGMIPTWATYFSSYGIIKQRLESSGVQSRTRGGESTVHMMSACGAGLITATTTNPIWVVKTRIQMTASNACEYTGTADACIKIWKSEGIAGFYKGLGPSLLGVSHITIQFPLYERFKKNLAEDRNGDLAGDRILSISELVLCAASSKIVASIFTYPHEVVRTRMYVSSKASVGMWVAYVSLFREGGVAAMYRGFLTNAFRVVPASAVTFVSYEVVYDWLNSLYGNKEEPSTLSKPYVEHKVCSPAAHPKT